MGVLRLKLMAGEPGTFLPPQLLSPLAAPPGYNANYDAKTSIRDTESYIHLI